MTPDEAYERVREDAQLRAVIAAARSWGVAPSVFLEGAPRQAFVVERDAAGRVVRLLDRSWTDDDRNLALSLAAYERDLCDGCGLPLSETTTAEAEFSIPTPKPVRCHGCDAIAIASEQNEGKPRPQALRYPMELRRRPTLSVVDATGSSNP